MARLFNLTNNYKYLLDNADTIDEQTLNDTLDSINEDIKVKADNTAKLIKSIDGDIATFKEERDRLNKRIKTMENNKNRIKERLNDDLLHAGIEKVVGKTFTIASQLNNPSLRIDSETYIPKNYYKEQEPKLDKKELLDDLKLGVIDVPGVEITQTRSIRIR